MVFEMADRALIIGVIVSVTLHLAIFSIPLSMNIKGKLTNRLQEIRLSSYRIYPEIKRERPPRRKGKPKTTTVQKKRMEKAQIKKPATPETVQKRVARRAPVAEEALTEKEVEEEKAPDNEKTIKAPRKERETGEIPAEDRVRGEKKRENTITGEGDGIIEQKQPLAEPPPPSRPESAGLYRGEFGASQGPRFLKRVIPSYPRVARRLGREGTVVLKLYIDREGRLKKVEVLRDDGPAFAKAAVKAVRQSSFVPAMKDGVPVDSEAVLTVKFRLKD